jgi:hypothetical protein
MFRALPSTILCVVAVTWAAAGCNKTGTYQVTWQFGPRALGTAPPAGGSDGGQDGGALSDAGDDGVTAALDEIDAGADLGRACAAYGIFGIRITGATDGSGDDVILPCTIPMDPRSVSAGTWSFAVHALDARGSFKQPDGGTGVGEQDAGAAAGVTLNPLVTNVVISSGANTAFTVVFIPQPECQDGVDNDCDGRVDQADPDCASGTTEGSPGEMACGSQ